ncbi:UTP--glucose-1-phosphate uridylyltransferase GalU [Thermaerobacter subterraneus]|uniref:UTP--glucose-1-phosphate uridylyltransferase n=1 Tax=Thermaerobacter subterraneus DSM 13965 TaxID=867903 RepID=K6PZC8_9FIRM|nr:UTP--glucose-1-phosphate uridylyltransferase GalU [Thermaerobacter subterraneus]EKP94143.1 UDP-glucose pyrophosphorylase [Thermaerobacter subterraneus DSM 13965]
MPRTVRKAVIPAAGLGTRFLPATKAQPKEMLPVVDKPIIQYVVEEAVAAGIDDILIVTGRGKRAIEDHFDRSIELEWHLERGNKDEMLEWVRYIADLADVHFVRQKEPLGLGHAVLQARRHVGDEPFAVLLGDEIFIGDEPALAELMARYRETGASVVAVREVPREQVRRYGVVAGEPVGEGLYRVRDMVEKPDPAEAPSNLAIVGRYIIEPEIFDLLERVGRGKNDEIQLTDALRMLARDQAVYAYQTRSRRYDVGEKLGFLQATVEFALMRPELAPDFRHYLFNLVDELRTGRWPGAEQAAATRQAQPAPLKRQR